MLIEVRANATSGQDVQVVDIRSPGDHEAFYAEVRRLVEAGVLVELGMLERPRFEDDEPIPAASFPGVCDWLIERSAREG